MPNADLLKTDPRTQRIAFNIKRDFRKNYCAALASGLLGAGLIDNLVRGIAFSMIIQHDDETDTKALLPFYEAAVLIVSDILRERDDA